MGAALSSRPPSNGQEGGVALLAVRVGGSAEAGFEDRLGDVRLALDQAAAPVLAPYLDGETIVIGYPDPVLAAQAARTSACPAQRRTAAPGRRPLRPDRLRPRPLLRHLAPDRKRRRHRPGHRRRDPARLDLRLGRFRRGARRRRRARDRRQLDRRDQRLRRRLGDRALRAQNRNRGSEDQLLEPVRRDHDERFGVAADDAAPLERVHRPRRRLPRRRNAQGELGQDRARARWPGPRAAGPGAAIRHGRGRPRTRRHARTSARPSAAGARP